MKLLFLVQFGILFTTTPVHSIELLGITKDKIHGDQAIIAPSKLTKHHLYHAGEQITRDYRLLEVSNSCIKIKHVNIVSEKCFPTNENLIDGYFSLVGKNINAKILLTQISKTLEIPIIHDNSIHSHFFDKIEIYNINYNDILSTITKLFINAGINIISDNSVLIASKQNRLEHAYTETNTYLDLKSDESITLNFNDVSAGAFFSVLSEKFGYKISYTIKEQIRINVIMQKPVKKKKAFDILLSSIRLMGYKLDKVSNKNYVVKKI